MPASPVPETVQAFRRFNRFYTRHIGALKAGLLDSPFSLTEARILYEIAHAPESTATDLCRELDLDAGYLSRVLARFGREGLVVRRASRDDARRSHLTLTAKGRRAFAALDRRSDAQASSLLRHLAPGEQRRLAGLMNTVHRSLSPSSAPAGEIVLRPPIPGDLGWVVQRHGSLYAEEFGWNQAFEILVARIVADFGQSHDPRREAAWIATLDDEPVGCIFLVRQSDATAKLRLLLVDPRARGRGLGRRLIDTCIAFARAAGYREVTLWTNDVLRAARHLYEAAGFKRISTEKHSRFGPAMIGETWTLTLA